MADTLVKHFYWIFEQFNYHLLLCYLCNQCKAAFWDGKAKCQCDTGKRDISKRRKLSKKREELEWALVPFAEDIIGISCTEMQYLFSDFLLFPQVAWLFANCLSSMSAMQIVCSAFSQWPYV